jgi:hypothetical protein
MGCLTILAMYNHEKHYFKLGKVDVQMFNNQSILCLNLFMDYLLILLVLRDQN